MNTNITNLKKEINSWQFASCPTEEKGLCWRWTKEGLNILAKHIKELMKPKSTFKRIEREITFTSKNFDFTPVSNPLETEAYEPIK